MEPPPKETLVEDPFLKYKGPCIECQFDWHRHPTCTCFCTVKRHLIPAERLGKGFVNLYIFVPHPNWVECGGMGVVAALDFVKACDLLRAKDKLQCGDPNKEIRYQEVLTELHPREDAVDMWVLKAKLPVFIGTTAEEKVERVIALNYHW